MTTETLTLNPEQWIWINTTARIEGENEVPQLYAKVLRPFDESGGRHLIHFTSVPPFVRARLNQILDQSPQRVLGAVRLPEVDTVTGDTTRILEMKAPLLL